MPAVTAADMRPPAPDPGQCAPVLTSCLCLERLRLRVLAPRMLLTTPAGVQAKAREGNLSTNGCRTLSPRDQVQAFSHTAQLSEGGEGERAAHGGGAGK